MRNKKGQATILIGIIFQVVFIFFAMVINVGLLVNDKINLQNSVDIAAYYAAMKQAEVLNTMAHVNFQMRQTWKLFNWRLWALGDIGRFDQFINADVSSAAETRLDPGRKLNICTRNQFWSDEWRINPKVDQNFCKNANFRIPAIKPLRLTGVQLLPIFGFMQVFAGQSRQNSDVFGQDCEKGAGHNYYYATAILASYKIAVANRKAAMRELQNLLIEQNDFKDIMGTSVRATTENVFKKNLTLANKESISEFEFYNSLNKKPFLVPINVRVRLTYTDMATKGSACEGTIKDIIDRPTANQSRGLVDNLFNLVQEMAYADYGSDVVEQSAEMFAKGSDATDFTRPTSTIGFEKNPWVLAYVKVKAQTKPKMLFSPIGNQSITLNAESYAMPFGGRLGPWYKKNWPSDQEFSVGAKTDKVDLLLPPRVGEPFDAKDAANLYLPNYSRFPGDELGMESALSRTQGIDLLRFSGNDPNRPSLFTDDYGNIIASLQANQFRQDPLVTSSPNRSQNLRLAELIAVAPDLFDALYYSVQKNFTEEFVIKKSANHLTKLCKVIACEDLGANVTAKLSGKQIANEKPIEQAILIINKEHSRLFWKIKDTDHLNTGWTQEAADRYLPLNGGPSSLIGAHTAGGSDGNTGGRVGYSVKLVSQNYLKKSLKLGGAKVNAANIRNPPP